jgi:hypothetical protein
MNFAGRHKNKPGLFVGVLVLSLGGLFPSACTVRSEQEAFILPAGYIGPVIILYEQQNGARPLQENGRQLIEVPASGLVKLADKHTRRNRSPVYYYRLRDGSLEEIPYLDAWGHDRRSFENISDDEKDRATFAMNDGGVGHAEIDGRRTSYRSFIVGTPKDRNKHHEMMTERIFQLMRSQ